MTPTLIVTRPASQGAAFANAVKERWDGPLEMIQSPLVAIKPQRVTTDLSKVMGVIFTSTNGVAASKDLNLPQNTKAWCVGEKTAALAQEAGFVPVIGPGDAAGLADLIIQNTPTETLAHIRGQHTRGDICARLSDAGITCLDIVAYDQTTVPLNAAARERLAGNDPVIFPLFSPRTAAILTKEGPFAAPLHFVVMSEAVRVACAGLIAKSTEVAARPDENAMITATLGVLQGLTQRRG